MSQIIILGQLDIHPEDTPAAAELMRVMMNETVKEQGCHHYAFSRDLATASRFQLSELWENEPALQAHFQSPHMATYKNGMSKLRILKQTIQRYAATNPQPL